MHHPKMSEYEEKILDPNWRPVIPGGHWDTYNAQERVVMRRHIRKFFPGFSDIIKLEELDHDQLTSTIHRLSIESMDTL